MSAQTTKCRGVAVAGTPYAADAAASILEQGGNAVDAAATALLVLCVTDLPMASLGGRSQWLIAMADGSTFGIDGATQTPAHLPELNSEAAFPIGYATSPVPGNPAAIAMALEKYGTLSFADVAAPAIRFAEEGYRVTEKIGAIWEESHDHLAAEPVAAAIYLRPDGSPYRAGELFRNPKLASTLERLALEGLGSFYEGALAEQFAADMASGGGFVTADDLASYTAHSGPVVTTQYRGYDIAALGGRAWGDTLIQMLQMLEEFEIHSGEPSPREVELMARLIGQALDDRPQELRSLRPKLDGFPLSTISSRSFARSRTARIRAALGRPFPPPLDTPRKREDETTHLSVIDMEGNAVSLTTSIGPRFGSGAAATLGFLCAHSYSMETAVGPGIRAVTEMTPTIARLDGSPVVSVGAAGSSLIPGAVLQVLSNVIDRGYALERAVDAPRIHWEGREIRLHDDHSPEVFEHLEALGGSLDKRPRSLTHHLGIVHAAGFDPNSGTCSAGADPIYDGAAAAPSL